MGRDQRANGNSGNAKQQPPQQQRQERPGENVNTGGPIEMSALTVARTWKTRIERLDACHNVKRQAAIDTLKNQGWRHYLVVPSFGTMQEHYFDKQE